MDGAAPRRKKQPNKNTNRNKEGFAFDKDRKKAPRKVVTYTRPRNATAYARLFLAFEITSSALPLSVHGDPGLRFARGVASER